MIGTKRYEFPKTFSGAMALPASDFKSLFGRQCIKGWDDLRQMEAFIRTVKPTAVIELGCGAGVHSLYLSMTMRLRDAQTINDHNAYEYYAIDQSCEAGPVMRKAGALDSDNTHFPGGTACLLGSMCTVTGLDVYKLDLAGFIAGKSWPARNGKPEFLLYLDIGPPDLETFAPQMPSGSYVVVHDWKHKNYKWGAERLIRDCVLEYFERETWERTGAHMGFMRT